MSDAVLAIISSLITGAVSVFGIIRANSKNTALISYRIEQLEKKQDKHNQLLERMTKAEDHIEELQHDVKELKERRTA